MQIYIKMHAFRGVISVELSTNLKRSKATWRLLILWKIQNQQNHCNAIARHAEREWTLTTRIFAYDRCATNVVLISSALARERLHLSNASLATAATTCSCVSRIHELKMTVPLCSATRHDKHSKIWFISGVDNVNWPPYRDLNVLKFKTLKLVLTSLKLLLSSKTLTK